MQIEYSKLKAVAMDNYLLVTAYIIEQSKLRRGLYDELPDGVPQIDRYSMIMSKFVNDCRIRRTEADQTEPVEAVDRHHPVGSVVADASVGRPV